MIARQEAQLPRNVDGNHCFTHFCICLNDPFILYFYFDYRILKGPD